MDDDRSKSQKELAVTVYLTNSTVLTSSGDYSVRFLSKDQFVRKLQSLQGKIKSYLGYPQNIRILREMGISMELNRSPLPKLQNGDTILVMKLKYRLEDVQAKRSTAYQQNLSVKDFEFLEIKYTRPPERQTGQTENR